MINIVKSEMMKYKRTLTRRLLLFAPLLIVLIAIPQKMYMPAGEFIPWDLTLNLVFNWWPVIFIPIGWALFAALAELQEKKAGHYRSLRSHAVHPTKIWMGKVVVMGFHSLLASLILILATAILGTITGGGAIPWSKIILASLTTWAAALAIIPLQLWIAACKGTVASMCMGLLGLILGVLAAGKSYWVCVPWSWPTRLMSPMIGIHPNGTILESNSSLLDPSAIPLGIGLSLISLVLLTCLTGLWFCKKEVR